MESKREIVEQGGGQRGSSTAREAQLTVQGLRLFPSDWKVAVRMLSGLTFPLAVDQDWDLGMKQAAARTSHFILDCHRILAI